ncbi:MAG: nucleotidyltransferase [Bacilli bacterium]|nr:nucleotidyltransferase [Bacilli bacterium]
MTLAIMAAGLGSRFGGLKQIEPIGPNGEFIIDYSIYDAIKAGFNKVVIVIKKDNYQDFVETIGRRIAGKIDVEYVFQEMNDIPEGYYVPEERVKPWGTGHVLYCLRNTIKEPFAVISADDFYGREPYNLLYSSLKKGEYSTIGYQIGNTLTENGSVKRGVFFSKDGYVTRIIESKVEKVDNKIVCTSLNGGDKYEIENNQTVSMLMFGFQPSIFHYVKEDIKQYFDMHKDNLVEGEYFLPDIITGMISNNVAQFKLIPTKAVWKGVTYREDLNDLKKYIYECIKQGVYPENLYE